MGTSAADLIESVRKLIPELDPIEWGNARLLALLNLEYKEWAAALGQIPGPGWFTVRSSFSMAANVTEYDLTDLTIDDGSFAAVKTLWYVPPFGESLKIENSKPGQEEMYVTGVGQTPVGQCAPLAKWLTRPGGVPTLNVGPESNLARNFRMYVRYEPTTLEEADEAQTDPRHDDVLVMGTCLRALKDVSEDDPAMRRDWLALKNQFLTDERNAMGEFESETTTMTGAAASMFGDADNYR